MAVSVFVFKVPLWQFSPDSDIDMTPFVTYDPSLFIVWFSHILLAAQLITLEIQYRWYVSVCAVIGGLTALELHRNQSHTTKTYRDSQNREGELNVSCWKYRFLLPCLLLSLPISLQPILPSVLGCIIKVSWIPVCFDAPSKLHLLAVHCLAPSQLVCEQF